MHSRGHAGGAFLLGFAVLCCAVLCCAVLCCAVLCCAVLCCAVLCCAVLCCAVLCCAGHAMLCHAVPCLPLVQHYSHPDVKVERRLFPKNKETDCLSASTGGCMPASALCAGHALFTRLYNSSTDLVVGELQSSAVTENLDRRHDS